MIGQKFGFRSSKNGRDTGILCFFQNGRQYGRRDKKFGFCSSKNGRDTGILCFFKMAANMAAARNRQCDLALTYVPKMLHTNFRDDWIKTVAMYREPTDKQTNKPTNTAFLLYKVD